MKFVKYLGILLFVAVLLFVVAANFSAVESRFRCSGGIELDGQSKPATIYMELHEYRWWVGLWSDSAGRLLVETPDGWTENYFGIEEIGHRLTIYESQGDVGGISGMRGHFSTLSRKLFLILKPDKSDGEFVGACERMERE